MTQSQKRALDAVQNMIEVKTDETFAHNIMILIFGILNVEHDMNRDMPLPLNPNDGNDGIQINIPVWITEEQTPPFSQHTPFPLQVWYNQEPEPIQTDVREDVRYVTEVSCTGDKNGIVCTTNTADVQYNGDFRDGQISFNDK